MMIQLLKKDPGCIAVVGLLREWFSQTRFNIYCIYPRDRSRYTPHRFKGGDIKIDLIRLKVKKPYHGNHPDVGGATGFRPVKPKVMSFLEAIDWIEFNDKLNDFCDHHAIAADISSRRCVIRQGAKRRICYSTEWINVRGTEIEIWARTEKPGGFMDASTSPLVPFSTFAASDPRGIYGRFTYL